MTRIIYDTSEDTRIREIARLREKALHDEASLMRQATEKGIAIGEKRGRANERKAIAERLKASGMSDEQIKNILS